ncbi:hypothetical protein Q4E40_15320 [Pontibacter sp. BT731]|uniref:hypothetical protein n=1 Tax=Pontibacter coccineus TaxID=3063328 RepID=UPI0026E26598|nr:hypothetical protein [Pontibacter sp. BT731]MDO6391508.1 hypothetical protein [Pontibacter sp. BT731]
MKRNLTPILFLIPVAMLSYLYSLTSFLLLAVMAFCVAALLVVGMVKAFRSNLPQKWVRIPLTIAAVCTLGVLIGLLRPLDPAVINSGEASDMLAYAYETDQADRMTIGAYLGLFENNMAKRDSIRLAQVRQLYQDNQISLPKDKFYAAFVFHHSKKSAFFEIAQKLAGEAAAVSELKDDYVVQWLARATYDRWMVSLGKPEKYGTQDKFSISVELLILNQKRLPWEIQTNFLRLKQMSSSKR